MQLENVRIALDLVPIELRFAERALGGRIWNLLLRCLTLISPKLSKELAPTCPDQFRQLGVVVDEIMEWTARMKFLAHEQHRCLRAQEEQRRQCAMAPGM